MCGDTPSWVYRHPRFPASAGWVLTLYLSSAAESPQTCTATPNADGLSYDFSLTSIITEALIPGLVHYTVRAVSADGTQTMTVSYGDTLVKPDPSKAVDRRTYNEQCLADVQAAIQSRLQGTVMDEYTLAGVVCKMPPLNKLQELKAFFESEVKREKGRNVMRALPVRLRPNRGGVVPFGYNRRPR